MFAELDRIITVAKIPKPITILDPHQRRSREVMKQIGIFELTKDKCDVVPSHRDVVYWRAFAGGTGSGDEMAGLDAVTVHINRDNPHRVMAADLWRGVSEAVNNSVEHAYLEPRPDGFQGLDDKRWWMFTQLRDGTFTVAVCDLGCGYQKTISKTLPPSFVQSVKARLFGTNVDAAAIRTAMEFGNSQTGDKHRGKGSRDALSLLKKHGNGEVFVASNTGWVRYIFEGGTEREVSDGALLADIRGTIIWWKLKLSDRTGD